MLTPSTISPGKKKNYLNNKDMLKEIHTSKNSYCYFVDPTYHRYDLIIDMPDASIETSLEYALDPERIQEAKIAKATRLTQETGEKILPEDIKTDSLIFRVMTWDHIPVSQKQPRKSAKKKTAKDIFYLTDESIEDFSDLEDATIAEIEDMVHTKVNFPPFQHFKLNETDSFICVGKSHWVDGIENGYFSKDHGNITNKLARMYIMLCQKYAMKFNWRGYCVDEATEALTKRGWLNIDEINENDSILSYNGKNMVWSSIKSIYRDDFNGNMFKLTNRNVDMLITPGHKMLTHNGLKPIELLTQDDRLILMGEPMVNQTKKYSDAFVELIGWIVTEGCYDVVKENGFLKGISIYQNEGKNAERIRNCLRNVGYKFYERYHKGKNIVFSPCREDARKIYSLFPTKNLTMDFILDLTSDQRELLIDTMIEGDGWMRGKNRSYAQKSKTHVELFQALCAISGIRTKCGEFKEIISFGKPTNCHTINLYSKVNNTTKVENIDMHGAKRTGKGFGMVGKGKINHPNEPTEYYKGKVWCPETEYGCFLARRNNHIYLTGNSYREEMEASAILQLTYVGLRFNESKSNNPFAYYTSTVNNAFCRVLNSEKRGQNIRDDILEANGLNPSFARQSKDIKNQLD